ncbi:DNA-binding CsgD family transcriptional regulator/sugar-specific transcriptional regulator TrmB [Streptacidiphilus sp. MAP12-16]|uniref:helix-turn-helix domain-containing protein n=1 Tax=Streptacidiphilus sp. MAP12-16 TaxID=3156300 RepID=UPI00351898A2
MLTALGLGTAEEEIYRLLIARPNSGADELAALTDLAPAVVDRILTSLVGSGLAAARETATAAGCTTVFTAAPPAVALGSMLRQRRDDLRAAEIDLLALVEQHRATGNDYASDGVIEVITDVDAVRRRFAQIQDSARSEVRSMMVANLSVVPHRQNQAGYDGLRRGVVYRVILQREALLAPGMVGEVIAGIAQGQQVRIADLVPVKMVIVDRDLAMVPLHSNQNTAAASILVHASGLLDMLVAFFEMSWERAYPMSANTVGDDAGAHRPGEIDELDARVLALVLAGLTDQAAARQLGLSRRTVQRRIGQLMARAGVTTRVQLGWHAARKGWA